MENKKQSSVKWLKDQLEHFGNKHELTVSWDTIDYLIQQAKAMHKEEMIDFGNDLLAQNDTTYIAMPDKAEQYYNETFGGNNE